MSDAYVNFAYSLVATAPSPATTGTSLIVTAGQGVRFPTPPFNAVVCPAETQPLSSNAEIVRVTNIATDTLTITRHQEDSTAKSIAVGWQIWAGVTTKTLTDIARSIPAVVYPEGAALDLNGAVDITTSDATATSATADWQEGQMLVVRSANGDPSWVTTINSVVGNDAFCSSSCPFANSNLTGFWGTDDTGAWQAALDAASAGQTVDAPWPYRTLIAGQLVLPRGVALVRSEGRSWDAWSNVAMHDWGPTFGLVEGGETQADGLARIKLSGDESGLGDVILYSLNQVNTTAPTPTAFAAFVEIIAGGAGITIGNPFLCNAYDGLILRGGRNRVGVVKVGATHCAVQVDESYDYIKVEGIVSGPFWSLVDNNGATGLGVGGLTDYALDNQFVLNLHRCDAFRLDYLNAGLGGTGILCNDSPIPQAGALSPWAMIGNIMLDQFVYGIYAASTSPWAGLIVGQLFTNGNVTGVGAAGQVAVYNKTPAGDNDPKISIGQWHVLDYGFAAKNEVGTLVVPTTTGRTSVGVGATVASPQFS